MGPMNNIFSKHGIEPEPLLHETIKTAKAAGAIIMGYYNAAANDESAIGIQIKEDESPVTEADKASSKHIETKLKQLTPDITVICEENKEDIAPEQPHWAVDPLDGTKLFINRTDGFAVNIALILDSRPVLGVVYCPAFNTMYYSYEGSPSYRQTGRLPVQEITTRSSPKRSWLGFKKGDLTTLFDKAHANQDIYHAQRQALEDRNLILPADPQGIRTLPQNLLVAEGLADIHIKTGRDPSLQGSGGFIWDNAADYIILKNAGGIMISLTDGKELAFDMVRERMPGYIAFGDKSLGKRTFQK